MAELRSIAGFCNFGESLEVVPRDHIVCGISDDGMQRWLLADSDLDYTKAVKIAINMEAAAKSI